MNGHNVRHLVLALTVLALGGSSAQACGHCRSWFGAAPVTTYAGYAPYTAAYAPACGQTVSYMPQTSYRTVYVNAPVVAYQPVSACNPCTGCPTTVMRPVVSYVTQARLVPYTTYRPVVAAAPACCGAAPAVAAYAPSCCGRAPVVAAYTPAVVPATAYAPVAAAPAPCCGAAAAVPSVTTSAPGAVGAAVPSLVQPPSYPAGAGGAPPSTFSSPQSSANPPSLYPPATAYPAPGTYQNSTTPAPVAAPSVTTQPSTLSPAVPAPQNKTFDTPPVPKPEPESRLILPPRNEPASDGNRALRGLDPENNQDRFTAIPLRHPVAVRPASVITLQARPNDATWQASRP
jgi:hypothetical protein